MSYSDCEYTILGNLFKPDSLTSAAVRFVSMYSTICALGLGINSVVIYNINSRDICGVFNSQQPLGKDAVLHPFLPLLVQSDELGKCLYIINLLDITNKKYLDVKSIPLVDQLDSLAVTKCGKLLILGRSHRLSAYYLYCPHLNVFQKPLVTRQRNSPDVFLKGDMSKVQRQIVLVVKEKKYQIAVMPSLADQLPSSETANLTTFTVINNRTSKKHNILPVESELFFYPLHITSHGDNCVLVRGFVGALLLPCVARVSLLSDATVTFLSLRDACFRRYHNEWVVLGLSDGGISFQLLSMDLSKILYTWNFDNLVISSFWISPSDEKVVLAFDSSNHTLQKFKLEAESPKIKITHSFSLPNGETVIGVYWQPLVSEEQKAVWVSEEGLMVGLLTNLRVIILNSKLEVINSCKLSPSDYVLSLFWIGRCFAFLMENLCG